MPEMTYGEATLLQAQNKRIVELEAEVERLREEIAKLKDRNDTRQWEYLRLIKENERLRETNEAIKRVTKEWRVYAERYRWLKTFALYRNEHDASIEFYWSRRAYDLDVDAAINAAMEG